MTTEQVAAELGITTRMVRTLAVTGRLSGATREGRDWIIPSAAVAAEKTRRSAPNKPLDLGPTNADLLAAVVGSATGDDK